MKKKNVLNLIKYHVEKNDDKFRTEAIEIAKSFDKTEDYQLAEYILTMLESTNILSPQEIKLESEFISKIISTDKPLPMPATISNDLVGIINAVNRDIGINKFLFEGHPGTGKTETAKHIARLLSKELLVVDFSKIIDSKLGATSKNIVAVFEELNDSAINNKIVVLFDEIDIIAMDRVNNSDIREMGRVTSIILRELDRLNKNVILIATTNLYNKFDKALTRRFDKIVNFDSYSNEDLIEISEILLNKYLKSFKDVKRDVKLFKKLIKCMKPIPYPGQLDTLIRTSLAFSSEEDEYDYLKRLMGEIFLSQSDELLLELKENGFTTREIEILTGVSKSKVSRDLKGLYE